MDKVFEPWLRPGGLLSLSLGQIIGTGPGRGSALMFIVVGAAYLVMTLAAHLASSFRSAETAPSDLRAAEAITTSEALNMPKADSRGAH